MLADIYDDGGLSGGTMERPALKRLLEDIEARRIDCVVVYKVDRLSRSLLDFAPMVDRFDQRAVSFVSVTQQFNTTSSLGRLTLNILLSFAQFEREIIGERNAPTDGWPAANISPAALQNRLYRGTLFTKAKPTRASTRPSLIRSFGRSSRTSLRFIGRSARWG